MHAYQYECLLWRMYIPGEFTSMHLQDVYILGDGEALLLRAREDITL